MCGCRVNRHAGSRHRGSLARGNEPRRKVRAARACEGRRDGGSLVLSRTRVALHNFRVHRHRRPATRVGCVGRWRLRPGSRVRGRRKHASRRCGRRRWSWGMPPRAAGKRVEICVRATASQLGNTLWSLDSARDSAVAGRRGAALRRGRRFRRISDVDKHRAPVGAKCNHNLVVRVVSPESVHIARAEFARVDASIWIGRKSRIGRANWIVQSAQFARFGIAQPFEFRRRTLHFSLPWESGPRPNGPFWSGTRWRCSASPFARSPGRRRRTCARSGRSRGCPLPHRLFDPCSRPAPRAARLDAPPRSQSRCWCWCCSTCCSCSSTT